MAWISTTFLAAATGGAGKYFRSRPTLENIEQHQELTLPTGFKMTKTRPSVAGYQGRAYYAGAGSDNTLVDEHYRVLLQGLLPPNTVPTLAAGAGTGLTSTDIAYIAWYDEFTDEWSPLSAASSSVALVNQNETVGNIPATPNDPRATHVGLFFSRDGAAPRLATKRQVGVTSVTSAVPTLSLASITGITDGNTFERFPRCAYNTFYHDRQVMAGDSRFPDRVYVSQVGFPERYGGLSFRTRNGEPIIGLGANRDVCIVFTPFSYYLLRGWTDEDMTLSLGDSDIGCMSHHTILVINDRIWWASEKGVWLYNGAPHYMLDDHQSLWQFLYKTYRQNFEAAFAAHDPNQLTYSVVLSNLTDGNTVANFDIPDPDSIAPQTIAFVCDYSSVTPELGGSLAQPYWGMDVWQRPCECAALLSVPYSRRRDVYYGFCDGIIRFFTEGAQDDDADTYLKMGWVRTKAYDFGDPGGDEQEGKTLVKVVSYVEAENNDWVLYCQGGDEKAYKQILPDNSTATGFWKRASVASEVQAELRNLPGLGNRFVTLAPKSVWPETPEEVSGRCFTFQYRFTQPNENHWRGLGGVYKPGPATRGNVELLSE